MILYDGHREYRVDFSFRRYREPVKLISNRFPKPRPRYVSGATSCTIRDPQNGDCIIAKAWAYCSMTDEWSLDTGRTLSFTRALADLDFDRPTRSRIWMDLWLELDRLAAERRRKNTVMEALDGFRPEKESEGSAQTHGQPSP